MLSKAFDSVDRNILLRKLKCDGVRRNMHLLINLIQMEWNSLLAFEGTSQPVKKLGYNKATVVVILIHLNDLENYTSLSVLNFADETMLYKTFTKNTYLNDSESFIIELKKVSGWLIENKFKLNFNKTKKIILHKSKKKILWKYRY